MLWLFVWPTRVYLLDFFCSDVQFYFMLSLYLCFISLLYLDLYVLGDDALIVMGLRELIALLNLSSWCIVMVELLFLAVPLGCLRFVIFPDHTHLLFFMQTKYLCVLIHI